MLLPVIPLALMAVLVNAPPAETSNSILEVDVVVTEKRPLALVDLVGSGQKQGQTSLDGAVEVTVTNRSKSTPVVLRDLDVHGLVFTPDDGGADRVVVHQCQCVRDMSEPQIPSFAVAPGATHRITLEEWGCSSMWTPPPPGGYKLRYRVLAAPAPRKVAPPRGNPREMVKQCRDALEGGAMWRTAVSSGALDITLKKPVRKPLPE